MERDLNDQIHADCLWKDTVIKSGEDQCNNVIGNVGSNVKTLEALFQIFQSLCVERGFILRRKNVLNNNTKQRQVVYHASTPPSIILKTLQFNQLSDIDIYNCYDKDISNKKTFI